MPDPNVNNMEMYQLSTILTSIVNQATGTANITPTTVGEFVSVAQQGLKSGYDPLMTAISQVLSKTIFSVRPYTAKFKRLRADAIRYGNHVRKLTSIDKPFEDDDRIKLVDGQSIDQYEVNKPIVLQANYYGEVLYQKSITIYKDQLDVAFSGPEEFGRFITMIMTNVSDMIEQAHEETARATVCNLIAGVYAQTQESTPINTERVIYLVDEYNTATGSSLTATTVKDPDNFPDFARWMFGFLKTVSDRLAERSALYHQAGVSINSVSRNVIRHTPLQMQKCYLYSPLLNTISANVLSTVFYDKYLQLMDHEDVTYWQSIKNPMEIDIKPCFTDGSMDFKVSSSAVDLENVMGVIFDEEACGYTMINEWSAPTPFNARGGYSNIFYHFTDRYWNDFTENAVVLLLDCASTEG